MLPKLHIKYIVYNVRLCSILFVDNLLSMNNNQYNYNNKRKSIHSKCKNIAQTISYNHTKTTAQLDWVQNLNIA